MPRYMSLFKYNAEGWKGFTKEKAVAREAALRFAIESAGGKLELLNWLAPGSEYSGVSIGEFPDGYPWAAYVVSVDVATGLFSEINVIELLTANEIDREGLHGILDISSRLLRHRSERPCDSRAHKRDELAPPHRFPSLLDHLVSSHQQCGWHRHTHRISGLEVDHQLEPGRLFDWDSGDFGATEELDLSGHYL
jgi:hypothetical protein